MAPENRLMRTVFRPLENVAWCRARPSGLSRATKGDGFIDEEEEEGQEEEEGEEESG